jgi:inosose dehydratase
MESCENPRDYPYTRVLDEIAAAGFAGTELGPYGFLPAEPAQLRRELDARGLHLCSAFIAFHLAERAALPAALADVRRTAKLISAAGATMLVLSDEISPERSAVAGRRDAANRLSWSDSQWRAASDAIHAVVEAAQRLGLAVAFHHHVGTHVETPEEIDRLLSELPASALGLCLDTGHYAYGGGDPVDLLRQHPGRTNWLHLKDVNDQRLQEARQQELDFHAGVRYGVFAPLGQGSVNFAECLRLLREQSYRGWGVVEQDVLPGGSGADAPLPNATAARQFLRTLGV